MSTLPRLKAMLNEVFAPTDPNANSVRTRFVTLDSDGYPEYSVRKLASGEFVYGASDPRAGEKVPEAVAVVEQVPVLSKETENGYNEGERFAECNGHSENAG